MRNLLFNLLLLSFAFSKNSFQIEIKNLSLESSQTMNAANILMMNSFEGMKYGTFAWVYKNNSWSEGYFGFTYMLKNFFQVGAGLGMEDAQDPLRLGGLVWIGKKDWYVLSLFEDGGSGPWHQVNAIYRFNKYLGFGLMEEKYTGFGPRFEFSIPNLPLQIWSSFLKLGNDQNTYITLKLIL